MVPASTNEHSLHNENLGFIPLAVKIFSSINNKGQLKIKHIIIHNLILPDPLRISLDIPVIKDLIQKRFFVFCILRILQMVAVMFQC